MLMSANKKIFLKIDTYTNLSNKKKVVKTFL